MSFNPPKNWTRVEGSTFTLHVHVMKQLGDTAPEPVTQVPVVSVRAVPEKGGAVVAALITPTADMHIYLALFGETQLTAGSYTIEASGVAHDSKDIVLGRLSILPRPRLA